MPEYGEAAYWNKRYNEDKDNPFDWLFDYCELDEIIRRLIPNQDESILVIGCGNAPFSPDL